MAGTRVAYGLLLLQHACALQPLRHRAARNVHAATSAAADAPTTAAAATIDTRTARVLQHLESEGDGSGAGAAGTLRGLESIDKAWEAMRRPPATTRVTHSCLPEMHLLRRAKT